MAQRTAAALVLAVMLALLPRPSAADPAATTADETSAQLATRLIELTGGEELAKQVMNAMFPRMRAIFPTVPGELWDELMASFDTEELVSLTVPIYTRNYTREDLVGLIEFYQSPLGRRVIEKTPSIMQESMTVGGQWGQTKAMEIFERLRQKGYQPTEI